MVKNRKIVVGLLICTSFLLILYKTKKKEESVTPEFVLTYAENHITDYPTTQGAVKFAQMVEKKTEGKVRIQVKANGEFGTQQQVVNQIQFGGIDFARVSLSSISDELPQLNVLQLPFLYENSEHMWKVLEGEVGKACWESIYDLHLIPLSWYDGGSRSFYSADKPIKTIEDIKGMTVRVQESQMMQDMITLLGGTPIDVAYSELYSAFETGKIDAAENNWPSYQISGHYEVAPYYTVDEHTRVPEIQLMSSETWKKLPEEYRKIIQECAQESSEYERQLWKEQEMISQEESVKEGCQVITLSEEVLDEFREKMIPLYEMYCSEQMDMVKKIQEMGKE